MRKFKQVKNKCLSLITAFVILILPLLLPVKATTAVTYSTVPTVHVLTHTFGGLSVLLEYNGHFGLIDSGEDKDSPATDSKYWHKGTTGILSKASEDYSITYFKSLGVTKENFEFFIGTHPHSDHIGAADEIIREFRPKKVYLQEYCDSYVSNTDNLWDNRYVYEKTIAAARAVGAEFIQNIDSTNSSFYLGGTDNTAMKIEIKNYGDDYIYKPTNDANDFSLGVLVTANGKKMFISGDINNFAYNRDEDKLAKEIGNVDALVLGHHGHYGSNNYNYVTTLNPELMIIPGSFSSVKDKGLDGDKSLLETLWYMGYTNKSKLFATSWLEEKGYNSLDVFLNSDGVTTNVPSGFEYFAETELSDGIWTGINYVDGLPYYDKDKAFKNKDNIAYDGTYYKNGYYMTGAWEGGSYNQNDENVYKFKSYTDNSYVTGWHLIYGKWYYFNSEGKITTGWSETNGSTYYLDTSLGGAVRTGLFTDTDGKQYYFSLDGKMMTGWVTVDNAKYFFYTDETTEHKKGEMAKNTLVGTNQYVDSSGVYQEAVWNGDGTVTVGGTQLQGGWLIWHDGYYYINPATHTYVTGWQTIDNITYYFKDSNSSTPGFEGGQMVTGPCNISGKLYYFSTGTESRPLPDANNENSRFGIGAKITQNDSDPWISTNDGKWYYINNQDGHSLVTGLKSVTNNDNVTTYYYFDTATGEMQADLTKVGDYYYYMRRKGDGGSEGAKVTDTGVFTTGYGKSYYVTNTDGVIYTTPGWQDITDTNGNTYTYYLYDDYSLAKGATKIGDEIFYFVNDGESSMFNGQPVGSLVQDIGFIHSTDGNVYYVYGTGKDTTAGGNGYTASRLFDESMKPENWLGWLRIVLDEKNEFYCFDDLAVMRTGFVQTRAGETGYRMYYLAQSEGTISVNGINFKEGQMIYGGRFKADDGSNNYYFARNDDVTGNLLTGVQKDNDDNYYYFINGDETFLTDGQPANTADKYKQVTGTGLIMASDGNCYYVKNDSEHSLYTGWINTGTSENPVWRYFYTEEDYQKDNNCKVTAMATGIYTYTNPNTQNKKTYYFSENDQTINGVFYEKGQMLTCGYFTDSKGNSYYTTTSNKDDGYLKEGWLKTDDGWHYFCTDEALNTPKYASVKGKTISLEYNSSVTQSYTFNENGVLVDENGTAISPMGTMSGDIETAINNNGIKLRLFNYSNEINYKSTGNNTLDNARLPVYTDSNLTPDKNTFFAFKDMQNVFPNVVSLVGRGGYLAEMKAKYDPFQLVPNHLTVERKLNNGYPKLDFTRDAEGQTRTDTSELTALDGYDLSLEYLFNENVSEPNKFAVKSYNPKDTFFQYDKDTSRYYYNSVNNAVDYDESENTCHLRNYVERTKYMNNAFIPFSHTTGDKKDLAYEDTDYWFGMTMEIEFVQSASGQISVKDKDGNTVKDDMVFSFSGDDDVWVFIDDTLVLDLGGIHNVAEGSINFNTGEIIQKISDDYNDTSYNQNFPTTLKKCFESAGTEPNGGWNSNNNTFADFTTHTMKFYYLERCAGQSNCSLSFNMLTVPNKSVVVSKDVYNSNNELSNDKDNTYYEFTVTKSNGQPLSVDEKTVTEMSSGNAIEVDNNGTFKLKGGEKAVFSKLSPDINYTISETNIPDYVTSTTVNDTLNSSVTITPSDSVQYVNFKNTIHTTSLTVKKAVKNLDGSTVTSVPNAEYKFGLRVYDDSTEHGKFEFSISGDQLADGYVIDNLPVGVSYQLWEYTPTDSDTSNRYGKIPVFVDSAVQNKTVKGNLVASGSLPSDNDSIKGTIQSNQTVTVTNTLLSGSVAFDKQCDKQSVDVGTTVNYTIIGKVHDTTGFTDYTYEITDTMTDGLTFNQDSLLVTIGSTDVTSACTITDKTSSGFKLSVPVGNYQEQTGENITVTYSAVVNKNTVAKIQNNNAQLTYSNNPETNNTTTVNARAAQIYSAKIVIDNYEAGKTDNKLAGAEFYMYKTESDGKTKKYYKVDTNGAVTWVDTQSDATKMTTDNNGSASFNGIADGTYYLEEVKAPDGYNLLADPVNVTVKGKNDNDTVVEANLTVIKEIENHAGKELPSTGSNGNTMTFFIGFAIVLVMAVLLIVRSLTRKKTD